jgi:hypothetical protein
MTALIFSGSKRDNGIFLLYSKRAKIEGFSSVCGSHRPACISKQQHDKSLLCVCVLCCYLVRWEVFGQDGEMEMGLECLHCLIYYYYYYAPIRLLGWNGVLTSYGLYKKKPLKKLAHGDISNADLSVSHAGIYM